VATFGDLKDYLDRAPGWTKEPNLARGRRKEGDHARYSKTRPDGGRSRTKVSGHPREEIGDDLFKHILRDQLKITEPEFWAVVRDQKTPAPPSSDPGAAPQASRSPGIPGWLVTCLVDAAGIPEDEVLAMTPEEADAAWAAYRSKPR
jgi:predicted RNA binding protein YcfA (HicA-like mRNA interferase family)